ncbi:DUF6850 family outer membrane beta-barrel protein [Faecalibacter macacae]|uniref:DUF6850 domain-containing protein n=1 Tax=Faecalibacter macacae TaxID=1859289 RepID=A0A3L9M987_9FLAO|nr:DUF6850 family outer membrane beta-barrel protein [Faecalibacter macacae]RLZ09093.1 hypothetical protein EAH69_08750 [Faecalibacter macacae]
MKSKIDLNSYDISLFARKNANKVFVLMATTLGGFAIAQDKDTIKIDSNPLYEQELAQLKQLPVTFANQNIQNFTQTEVYFNFKKNEFARKQTASETMRYGFRSQGLFNVKEDLKIFGSIDLQKYTEKDLAYTLDDTRTDDMEVLHPQYYFVPRSSNWNNQQYDINAGVIKSFGNFNLAAKAGLYANKLAREVDPRPEISNRKLSGEIHAGYTYGNHQIFALAGYAVKDKDYSYYYSNSQLNNIAYPDTYLRYNSGFGRVINRPFLNYSSGYYTRTTYKKAGAGYQYNSANTLLSGQYTYQENLENFYDDKFMNDKFKRFQYQTITHQGAIRLKQNINDKILRSSLSGFKTTSKNYDVKALGTNYMNRQRNITFDVNLLKQNNQIVKYYVGAFAAYNQNRYMDQLGYVDQKINSLTAGIYANRDIESKNDAKFNVGVGLNYYTALKNELDFLNLTGATDNVFYKEVIAHDFVYNSMDKLDAKADVRYILPVKNNKNVVIYTQLRSIFALDKNRNQTIDLNTETTYQVNFGIQLNY